MRTIKRINPTTLANPVGKYAHVTVIPPNATLYTFSGQIGTDPEGNLPADFRHQVDNTFANISHLLESQALTAEDIIKVNIWATREIDWDYFYAAWDAFFNTDYPSMTIGYLNALGLPEINIEIEVWAAK